MAESLRVLWYAARRSTPLPLGTIPPISSLLQLSETSDLNHSLRHNPAHVVVVELDSGRATQLIRELAHEWPEVGLVAFGADELLAAACAAGAHEVLSATQAADAPAMVEVLARAARRGRVAGEDVGSAEPDFGLLGSSKPMQQVRELISKLAVSSATVLVRGETGTGKELVAKAIHDQSRASSGPFVPLHAAALPHELLESELFGYERGAFTGATTAKPGRVELAAGGSLFLDEIAEISASVQTKLLRLLQEREFSRLGATRTLKTDTRFITATHRNLELMAERGEFRQDLLYRLNVLTVWLPPLRARREDIGELAEHFLARFATQRDEPKLSLEPAALKALCENRWPGNVRELANVLERLSVLTPGGVIREADVRAELEGRGAFTTQPSQAGAEPRADFMTTLGPVSSVRPLKDHLQKAERAALLRALERAKGNRTIAARLLGVGRRTLYTKLEEHDLL